LGARARAAYDDWLDLERSAGGTAGADATGEKTRRDARWVLPLGESGRAAGQGTSRRSGKRRSTQGRGPTGRKVGRGRRAHAVGPVGYRVGVPIPR
jgi:hypothetical protein